MSRRGQGLAAQLVPHGLHDATSLRGALRERGHHRKDEPKRRTAWSRPANPDQAVRNDNAGGDLCSTQRTTYIPRPL
ncbi:MAG: hypothetical protein H0V50_04320 [Thermoleophilaceae bacterium]|nr:hypothetical protein [Thermoleophilaceae bacterium]